MCLNLINSQYKSIKEVETLLNNEYLELTETDIINMKDNRQEIEKALENAQELNDIMLLA